MWDRTDYACSGQVLVWLFIIWTSTPSLRRLQDFTNKLGFISPDDRLLLFCSWYIYIFQVEFSDDDTFQSPTVVHQEVDINPRKLNSNTTSFRCELFDRAGIILIIHILTFSENDVLISFTYKVISITHILVFFSKFVSWMGFDGTALLLCA